MLVYSFYMNWHNGVSLHLFPAISGGLYMATICFDTLQLRSASSQLTSANLTDGHGE